VRPAERGKEVVERVHVRDVDGGELQAPFVAVTAEEVAITDGHVKKVSRGNTGRVLVITLGTGCWS
jgi:hypothetical protein